MARKKADPQAQPTPVADLTQATVQNAESLVKEYFDNKDFVEKQTKAFNEHMKPYKDRMEAIENQFLGMFVEQGIESLKTEFGTPYKSTITSPKVENREAFIDFCMDNWPTYGAQMLQVGSPQKDAVQQYADAHNGQLPPGVNTTTFTRVNIRRS